MPSQETLKIEMQKQNAVNQKHPLVAACGRFLQATVENNDNMKRQPHEDLSSFEDENPSTIRADVYVKRIMKYGGCSPSTLSLGLLYVDRLKRKLLRVWLTPNNVQRLFLVAVMEAVKMWEDFYYSNEHWAKIGGVSLQELNKLEVEFLTLMNWELYVSAEEHEAFSASILQWKPLPKTVALKEAKEVDVSNVPRCLWDSLKLRIQTEPSSPLSAQPTAESSPAQSPSSAEQASPSAKDAAKETRFSKLFSSSFSSLASSASARSGASTPRACDGEASPSSSTEQAEAKEKMRLWGQLFNVVS